MWQGSFRKVDRSVGILYLASLFALGFVLRLPGLLVNGTLDLDEIIIKWGSGVREWGLARGFAENYGVFSYALYGFAVTLAEQLPRFWWAPYKLMEVAFEVAVVIVLYKLLPPGRRHLALLLYWINPWFALHGAWQGFWEGPHTLSALLAVLGLARLRSEKLAWGLAGLSLMTGAMFKPQGLVYFVLPLGLYLGLHLIYRRPLPLASFALGCILVLTFATGLLVANGGEVLAIPRNYLTAATVMPNLCNDCINIWRPITRLLQAALGQSGFTYWLRLPAPLYNLLHLLAFSTALALMVIFCWKALWSMGWRVSNPFENQPYDLGVRASGCIRQGKLKSALQSWERPKSRSLLAIRSAGLVAGLLFVVGLFHTSSPEHAWLILDRYSWKYGLALGWLLLSGGIAILAPARVTSAASRLTRVFGPIAPTPLIDLTRREETTPLKVLLILAFSSLVIPQLGTRAHINHTYAALVLLIPIALANRRIMFSWIGMVAIHLYSHLAAHQLGRTVVLPQMFQDYLPAQPLIARINAALLTQPYDSLRQFQMNANQFLERYLPNEPIVTVLSILQFVCVVVIIYEMSQRLESRAKVALPIPHRLAAYIRLVSR